MTALFFGIMLYSCSPKISKKLQKERSFQSGFIGISIYDPETGKSIYEYNSNRYFTPASNIKILTFLAGIEYLKDSLTTFNYYQTQDTLFFSANADPSFLNPNFNSSKALDFLNNTEKHLIYIPSNYEDGIYGPGWAWDDYSYSFSTEKSAFPIYGNLVKIEHERRKGTMIKPDIFKDSIRFKENSQARLLNKNIFFVAPSNESYERKVPFIPSESLSLRLLKDTLKKPVKISDKDINLNKEFKSIPSDTVYKFMLQESDNFIAEQLLLMISNKFSDTLKSSIAIKMKSESLKELPNEVFWVDGSGLSRYNLVTPASMVAILQKILKLKSENYIKDIFPTAGKNGTLKNLLDSEAPFVYAKSGSLRNNYSLSGFLTTKKGKFLIFSFMNSNFTIPTQELKDAMEDLLIMIRDHY